jgi:predicted DNA-binding protein (UPF0251 family)
MARPRKRRFVEFEPDVTYFKPHAIPLARLEEVELTVDELEAMRLSDLEKLNQIESAEKMDIHQSTFQRTLVKAREKVSLALVRGKAIKIHGGEYTMPRRDGTGPAGAGRGRGIGGGQGQGQGRGLGRGGFNAGLGGNCVCPSCGYKEPHVLGQPCNKKKCPKCGNLMTRE